MLRATTPTSLEPTQEVEYSQSSAVSEPHIEEVLALHVVYGRSKDDLFCPLDEIKDFSIGRYESNDFPILSRYVSAHQHCLLRHTNHDGESIVAIHALARNCWIEGDAGRWKEVEKGKTAPLTIGRRFRLIRSPKDDSPNRDIADTVVFRLVKLPASVFPETKERFSLDQAPKVATAFGYRERV